MNFNEMKEKVKSIILDKHIENYTTLFRETRQDKELEYYVIKNRFDVCKMIDKYLTTGNVNI